MVCSNAMWEIVLFVATRITPRAGSFIGRSGFTWDLASNDLASTFLSFCGSVPVRVVHVSHVLTHTRLVIFYPLLKVPSGQPIHVLPLTVLLLCRRSIVGLMHICFYLFSHRACLPPFHFIFLTITSFIFVVFYLYSLSFLSSPLLFLSASSFSSSL